MRRFTIRSAWPAFTAVLLSTLLHALPSVRAGSQASPTVPLLYRPSYSRVRDYRVTDRRVKVYLANSPKALMELDLHRSGAILDLAYNAETRDLFVMALREGRALVRRLRANSAGETWLLPKHLAPESILFRVHGTVRLIAEDVRTGSLTRFSIWRFRQDEDLLELTFASGQREPSTRFVGRGYDSFLRYDALVGGDEVHRRRSILQILQQLRYSGAYGTPAEGPRSSTALLRGTWRGKTASGFLPASSVSPPSLERTPMCVRDLNSRRLIDFSPQYAVVANTMSDRPPVNALAREETGKYRSLSSLLERLTPIPARSADAGGELSVLASSVTDTCVASEVRPTDGYELAPAVVWVALSGPGAPAVHVARGMLARRLEHWRPAASWSPFGDLPTTTDQHRRPGSDIASPPSPRRELAEPDEGVNNPLPAMLSAGFSPDGKLVVTGDEAANVRVWDVAGRREVARLTGHRDPVRAVAFSPDGRRIVTASEDSSARLWDMGSGRELKLMLHPRGVSSVVFSPDGKLVLTSDGVPRLWDAATGEEVRDFAGPRAGALFVALSRSGRLILAGYGDGKARLWDTRTGRQVGILDGGGWLRAGAISHDEAIVMVSSRGNVLAWDRRTGNVTQLLAGHTGELTSVSLSPAGHQLLTSGADGTVRLYDLRAGKQLRRWEYIVVEEGVRFGWGEVNTARFSRGGQQVLAAIEDGTVRVWETGSGRELAKLPDTVQRVLFETGSP